MAALGASGAAGYANNPANQGGQNVMYTNGREIMTWLLLYADDGDVYVLERDRNDIAFERGITNLNTKKLTEFLEKLDHQDLMPFPGTFAIAQSDYPRPRVGHHPTVLLDNTFSATWLQLFPDGDLFLMEGALSPTVREYFETGQQTQKLLHCLRHLTRLRPEDYPTTFAIAPPGTPKPVPPIPHATSVA